MTGGSGVWGDVAMAAHPNISQSDLSQIIQYVLGLSNKGNAKKSLPASGTIVPPADTKPGSALVLTASYTDKGGNNIKALTGRNSAVLGGSSVTFTGKEKMKGFTTANYNGTNYMLSPKGEGWFALDSIDLTGVGSANLTVGWQTPPLAGFDYEIRLDTETGKVIGTGSLQPGTDKKAQFGVAHIAMQDVTDGQLHTIYVYYKPKNPGETAVTGVALVQFNGK